jgi:hypothetical protein
VQSLVPVFEDALQESKVGHPDGFTGDLQHILGAQFGVGNVAEYPLGQSRLRIAR